MNKAVLRKQLKQKRDTLSISYRSTASLIIQEKVLKDCEQYATISCYVSFQSEVSTLKLICELMKHRRIVVPRVVSKTHMEFIEIDAQTTWKRSRYGIKEPIDGRHIAVSQIDCCLIPLLGFDASNHRLGYGGGYYDRVLSKSNAITIGLAFDEQEVEQVPVEEWDIPLDKIITPTRILIKP